MPSILKVVLIALALVSCKSTSSISEKVITEVEVVAQKYQILVQFRNREGLKRTLYRLNKFQLQLKSEVSASEFLYMLEIQAKPYEIDGIVEKMSLDEDVNWAKKITD